MFKKKRRGGAGGDDGYDLGWPTSQRWKPDYEPPRNSIDPAYVESTPGSLEKGIDPLQHFKTHYAHRSMSWGRTKRDADTFAGGKRHMEEQEQEEFDNLTLWFETLAELYMNDLDNRARWDPRWLNITRRERFEGLSSASVTVIDYLAGDTVKGTEPITSKKQLAATLTERPKNSEVRIIMVKDLSRFLMGALGHMYSVDPEFWFEHLVNSGYGASDSGLKYKNAVWMNWAERETKFRHRVLAGPGSRTEWNSPRRTKERCWAHMRWGRLGLVNYLARKGFHEDEIAQRIGDGRWVMERDVELDKRGLLMTTKRQLHAEKRAKERSKKKKKPPPPVNADGSSRRIKTSNVYRPYSTFGTLNVNTSMWLNRDTRAMAPEGISYWSTVDGEGKKTIILLFDPMRNMRHEKTREVTPSLTFMPRALELEVLSDEELWRTAEPDETFLDPPPPLQSSKELKKQKQAAKKKKLLEKKDQLQEKLAKGHHESEQEDRDYESDSSYTSDSEYDEDYEKSLRADYSNPKPFTRDRHYSRKYELHTQDLVSRYLKQYTTTELVHDDSIIPSIITRLYLDDLWQLLAEIKMGLDHIDGDLGADLHLHLLESVGTTTRQNVGWMRSTLQELREWTEHLTSVSNLCHRPADLTLEVDGLRTELQVLHVRTEQTLSILIAATGLSQSALVIDQTSGINKLTELAFFFVPLSFITSVFSMQVVELTSNPPRLWTWGLSLSAVFLSTYLVRCALRSPSFRIFAMHCRVTMLNRFTSSQSASKRLNAVSNRAIAKFLFFFISVVTILSAIVFVFLSLMLLLFGGIWIATTAIAIYFIVTRWPELDVIIPCFISLVLGALGMWANWFWYDEIGDWVVDTCLSAVEGVKKIFPTRWTLDSVDDDDLAKEGVDTYARQAIILATA